MRTKLSDIAKIKTGHTIRKTDIDPSGEHCSVVQIQNIGDDGHMKQGALKCYRLRTIPKRSLLHAGDVLLCARGKRNVAACYNDELPMATVAASQFFVIKADRDKILPEYIAWILNQSPAQHYFKSGRSGSHVKLITKPVLENLPLDIPPLKDQRQILQINELAQRERNLSQELTQKRFDATQAMCMQIATGEYSLTQETNND